LVTQSKREEEEEEEVVIMLAKKRGNGIGGPGESFLGSQIIYFGLYATLKVQ
jgi:hypothetical protein